MLLDEEAFLALTDRFHASAIGADSWPDALQVMADACGSKAGQLIGLGSRTVNFNWITNVDPSVVAEFVAIEGGRPDVNPRVRAGMVADPFTVLTEADFITRDEHKTKPIYADFFARYDIPFICLTNVVKTRDALIGLSVNRSRREGPADQETRELISRVAPHVRAAVRTQLALEGQGAAIIAGAMDALAIAAFVCDSSGRVLATSHSAEALLANDRPLRLVGGRLAGVQPGDGDRINAAIARSLTPKGRPEAVVVRTGDGELPLVLDVSPLPRRSHGFTLDACALVVARVKRLEDGTEIELLREAFGLTQAEAEITVLLVAGWAPVEIAARRASSLQTVRTQIRNLYPKVGVKNRGELAAALGRGR